MLDIHSHLLPDVDDGVDSFEESLELLEKLAKHGMTELVVTPHYIPDTIYTSPRSDNLKLLDELMRRINQNDLDLKVHLGSEIYITNDISRLLKKKIISPLASSKYLLIELPMSGLFPEYETILNELVSRKYKVILAHPERCFAFQKKPSTLERLHNNGILFQCNYGSVTGQYGLRAKKLVEKLAKKDLIFTLSTDARLGYDCSIVDKAIIRLAKIYGEAKLSVLLTDNPLKIVS